MRSVRPTKRMKLKSASAVFMRAKTRWMYLLTFRRLILGIVRSTLTQMTRHTMTASESESVSASKPRSDCLV